MLLKSIQLHNIRSYTDASITFPQGIVLLSGDIGSGKSTILLAIEFALFGVRRGDLEGSMLLRHGSPEGFVELSMEINSKQVQIKRILKAGAKGIQQQAGYLITNGVQKSLTAVELRAEMLALLGYPPQLLSRSKDLLYRFTVFTPQEEMKQILYEDHESRLDTLRRLFGIDAYKRVQENSQIILRWIREDAKLLEGQCFDLPAKKLQSEQLAEQLTAAAREHSTTTQQLQVQQTLFVQQEAAFKQAEQTFQQWQEKKHQFELAQSRLGQQQNLLMMINQQLQTTDHELRELQQQRSLLSLTQPSLQEADLLAQRDLLQQQLQQHASTQAALAQQDIQLKASLRDLASQELHLLGVQKDHAALQSSLAELSAQMQKTSTTQHDLMDVEQQCQKLLQQEAILQEKMRQASQLLASVQSLMTCPVCLQNVAEDHKEKIRHHEQQHMSSYETVLQQLRQSLQPLQEKRAQLHQHLRVREQHEKKLESAQATAKAFAQQLIQLPLLLTKKQTMEQQRLSCQQQLIESQRFNPEILHHESKKLDEQLLVLRTFHEQQKRAQQIDAMLTQKKITIEQQHAKQALVQEEIKQLLSTVAEVQHALEGLSFSQTALDSLRKSLATAQQQLQHTQLLQVQQHSKLQHLKSMDSQLQPEIVEKEAIQSKAAHERKLETWTKDRFLPIVGVIEKHVLSTVYHEFNSSFRAWFSQLVDDPMLSVRLDDTFTPLLEQNGYETTIHNLSGGEKNALALAYRLALNRVVNQLVSSIKTKNLLILDEPTDGFSSEQLENVRTVLRELKLQQIILVSHEAKIEGFVDHVVRVVKREGESWVI
ncbi:SMC family ATPase [Candidatus Woesearchaeota archaeon]|nr:SMC family ATPase [Candidatus Woesearchaeota archaeon]